MKEREELELILKLIEKYHLPLSPILEYAVKEKMEEYQDGGNLVNVLEGKTENAEEPGVSMGAPIADNDKQENIQTSNDLRIVEFGERTIAVIGDTKPHKDSLRAMGGYFMIRTQWGPAWIFRSKKRDKIQAYINGDITIDTLQNEKKDEKKPNSRYLIRVKYPNGREFCSKLVWETLVDVVTYAKPESVMQLGITCMGDNLVSAKLNENPLYRSAQKELGRGLYVCTYSSTDVKYNQIRRINQELNLGLSIERVYLDGNDNNKTPNILDELTMGSRDRTKYSFEGGEMLSKRRFVLEVIKYYVHCHPYISYESLIRIFPSTLNSYKSNGVIKRYNDVVKQITINPEVRKRFFLKDDEIIVLSNGMKIAVHNQWGDDFNNFLKVARSLYDVKSSNVSNEENSVSNALTSNNAIEIESGVDKRIGYTVRLFPSQLKGEIVRVHTDRKGIKKLVVKTDTDKLVEINDLPYLYEVLKR